MKKFTVISVALAILLALCVQRLYNARRPHKAQQLTVLIVVTNGVGNQIGIELPYEAWVGTNKLVIRAPAGPVTIERAQ